MCVCACDIGRRGVGCTHRQPAMGRRRCCYNDADDCDKDVDDACNDHEEDCIVKACLTVSLPDTMLMIEIVVMAIGTAAVLTAAAYVLAHVLASSFSSFSSSFLAKAVPWAVLSTAHSCNGCSSRVSSK